MIFDTDVLIWASRGNTDAQELILATPKRAVSIISLMELFQGTKSKADLKVTRQFFTQAAFEVIPVNAEISFAALSLIETHAHADGLRIEDALIAATARETGETLATANVRHFRAIPNLSIKAFRPKR